MKLCSKCGAPIKDEETACPKCGAPCESNVPAQQNATVQDHSKRDENQATLALVFGILAVTFSAIGYIVLDFLEGPALPLSVLAIVFGAMRRNVNNKARAGLVLGIIGAVLATIGAILVIVRAGVTVGR